MYSIIDVMTKNTGDGNSNSFQQPSRSYDSIVKESASDSK